YNNIRNFMYVGVTEDRRGPSYPTLLDNCLSAITGDFARLIACEHNTHNINCINNFWGSGVNTATLQSRTYDGHDGTGCGLVLYDPLSTSWGGGGLCTQ